MESLNLPAELLWDGKMEPSSPSSELFSLCNTEESWLLEDNFAKDILLLHDETETETETEEYLDDSIIDGEILCEFEYDIKREQWIDGKFGIPQYMECCSSSSSVSGILSPQPPPPPPITPIMKVQNPYEIVMEFEKFYDDAELTQLTPPQTPPQQQDSISPKDIFDMITLRQQQNQTMSDITNLTVDMLANMSPSSSSNCGGNGGSGGYSSDSTNPSTTSDIAVQIVDEILRTRAKDLPDWINDQDDNDSLYSSTSSSSQSIEELLSSTSSTSSVIITPLQQQHQQQHQNNEAITLNEITTTSTAAGGKIIKNGNNLKQRRTRPYGRAADEKKSRKKEQNKNAATRYRQKKKEEMKEILDEERHLLNINEKLLKISADRKREVKYLKNLIKEFHKNIQK